MLLPHALAGVDLLHVACLLAVRVGAVRATAAVELAEVAVSAGKGAVVTSPSTTGLGAAVARSTKVDAGTSEALACLAGGEESGSSEDDGGELHVDIKRCFTVSKKDEWCCNCSLLLIVFVVIRFEF